MKTRHLNAIGKGEVIYDHVNDILLFKVKDREYLKSVDFDNIVIDIDKQGFITGTRIFDASKIFDLPKISLRDIRQFDFNAKIEDQVITLRFQFIAELRNKPKIVKSQDFVRDSMNPLINDSEVHCTVA